MKLSLKKAEFFSFLAASLLGVLFHFVYEWTGNNKIAGLFFPVNESTWEHLKLVFFPILLVSAIEYYLLPQKPPNFICTKFFSALLGMFAVVVLFYTYSGVLGRTIDAVNIIIYFISMAIAYLYSYRRLSAPKNCAITPGTCIVGVLGMILLFIVFTNRPPDIGLFKVP